MLLTWLYWGNASLFIIPTQCRLQSSRVAALGSQFVTSWPWWTGFQIPPSAQHLVPNDVWKCRANHHVWLSASLTTNPPALSVSIAKETIVQAWVVLLCKMNDILKDFCRNLQSCIHMACIPMRLPMSDTNSCSVSRINFRCWICISVAMFCVDFLSLAVHSMLSGW